MIATLIGLVALDQFIASTNNRVYRGLVKGMDDVVRQGADIVKKNASGRPGPNVITGTYRRSILTLVTEGGDGIEGHIYTDAPQALRLEFGFRGSDILGRTFDQPPYPHFQPAVPEVAAIAERILGQGVRAELGIG
jgi:hypothetical protein